MDKIKKFDFNPDAAPACLGCRAEIGPSAGLSEEERLAWKAWADGYVASGLGACSAEDASPMCRSIAMNVYRAARAPLEAELNEWKNWAKATLWYAYPTESNNLRDVKTMDADSVRGSIQDYVRQQHNRSCALEAENAKLRTAIKDLERQRDNHQQAGGAAAERAERAEARVRELEAQITKRAEMDELVAKRMRADEVKSKAARIDVLEREIATMDQVMRDLAAKDRRIADLEAQRDNYDKASTAAAERAERAEERVREFEARVKQERKEAEYWAMMNKGAIERVVDLEAQLESIHGNLVNTVLDDGDKAKRIAELEAELEAERNAGHRPATDNEPPKA